MSFVSFVNRFLLFNSNDSMISASTKLHYSMENLSKIRASSSSATSASSTSSSSGAVVSGSHSASPASSFMSSRSCDSIYSLQKAKINPKLPNGTVNILDKKPPQQQQQQLARSRGAATVAATAASKKEIMTQQQ